MRRWVPTRNGGRKARLRAGCQILRNGPRKGRRPAMLRKRSKAPQASSTPARKDRYAGRPWAWFPDDEVGFEMPGRRSADPHSPIPQAGWEPSPAAVIVVVGINAHSTKAAVDTSDMMEAADATEVSGSETAVGVADTVDAGMEGVSAAVTAAVTAAVRATASAVFRSMDLSPLQAVHPRQCYRRRLNRR